ncbi:response regulator transcription factor [Fusibacillus kribbianus]|uniref:Stage 0 sporulation protein A homolog n=1 Tax=Fusibacillus kribbianus TaxID=3044208 RepID=A0AAP4B967_9FIRM|nr:response regulator transcription factor [Ruminococcus sp. YH-rum2234]MDI9242054.1 response regulator transcription factor [Ruminococcus sp. YH-rum2234]
MGERILIVEDEPSVREGLIEALAWEGYEPCGVETGEEALEKFQGEKWDLCILDVKLPGESGFEVCRKLREHWQTPILFLTAFSDEANTVRGLELGGDDYVAKPFRLKELLSRVRSLIRRARMGQETEEGKYLTSGAFSLNLKSRKIEQNGEELIFTPKECQMVYLLMNAWPDKVSRQELVEVVWDKNGKYIEDNTIRVHVSRLREKLGTFEGKTYLETVRGVGYRWNLPVKRQ